MRKSVTILLLIVSFSCFDGEGGYRLIHIGDRVAVEKMNRRDFIAGMGADALMPGFADAGRIGLRFGFQVSAVRDLCRRLWIQ